jgi:hypothetical protein
MSPTPHASCSEVITKLIEAQYAVESELRQYLNNKTDNIGTGLSLAVALQNEKNENLDDFQKALRGHFLSNGSSFKTRNVRQLLDGLLAVDIHLKACCLSAWGLARAIEVLSPIAIRASNKSWDEGGQTIAVAHT